MAPPARASYRATFAVLIAAVAAFSLIQSLLLPVLDGLAGRFDTDRPTIAWLLTAYLLSASVCTPVLGRLGDAWGMQQVLVGCLAALAVGCAVSAVAPSLGWMIAGRVIQGAGGGILPVTFGIIRERLPPHRVPAAISLVSSLLAVGAGGGIVAAGPVADHLGYPALSWLPCAAGALAAAAAHWFVPKSRPRRPRRISVGPVLALTGWLVPLILGISQAPRWGWLSWPTIGLLTGACVVLALWIRAEATARAPLVDLALMRRRGVWTANAVAFLVGFGLYASSTLIPQLAQTTPPAAGYGLGVSVTESGLMMLPSCLASFLAGLAAAPAAARIGGRVLVVLGCLAGAGGMALIALAHEERWQIYLGSGLSGLGIGLTLALLANLVIAAVPQPQTGVATGMNANIRTIGGAIGSAVLAGVLAANPGRAGTPAESGYVIGFLALTVAMLGAAAVALAIPGPSAVRPARAPRTLAPIR
ncbi:MFS transporter [Dactylosporangium siamense]|uniref:MFS transporter n=1 Tax=Dactylosporangium siamense TaxID=685454 RepID=UPI0036198ED6